MCGVLGIVNLSMSASISPNLLQEMVAAMRHRGPDDQGVWVQQDGQVGFAHQRLSIMDLSKAGHQPMSSEDGNLWVTFNGEIYNYPELRKAFEGEGVIFRSSSDTEIIHHVYRKYGLDFVRRLDGDFAIGLWDQSERRLIICRDRAGVKPLYFTKYDGRFIFASEIKALIRYPGIPKDIDPESLYHYLTYLVTPAPKTLIKGIHKLRAGSFLTVDLKTSPTIRTQQYWEPLPLPQERQSFEALDEKFEELYRRSVKKRMMSDVPVGVLFSGGVDSTLNSAAFQELLGKGRVKTFTVGMDNSGDFHDDSIAARDMSRLLGTEHHEVRINETDLLKETARLAEMQDEPVSDPVSVPLYFVTRLARESGVTVLQAGEGADEIFCGYDNYRRALDRERKLWRPLKPFPKAVTRFAESAFSAIGSPRSRKIADVLRRHARGQEFFMSSAVAYYEREKQAVLSREMRDCMAGVESFDIVRTHYDRLKEVCPEATQLQKMTFIELQLRLPELLLMRADKMSMANSVETRVPFLDQDLVDFSLSVPDSYKLRDGISKEPVKRLASKYVDRSLMYRRKTGFGVPLMAWFRGALGGALMDMLGSSGSQVLDLLDVAELRRRIEGQPRTANEGFQLWVIYNVIAWQRALQ